ncbi:MULTISPECIES: 4-hydroxybenzoate 3-monooxygenase [unclassified Streptomyces]|uniref:4-hydroxybenzoate 3-monooxygenase n=1 Tax=unclassified Streptomyces TaxID=2593676 RepID=UPI00074A70C8|nr:MULTISPECIES: 4-hydroxybenzoate 3-monooxygenase [unclassified Streptomyces]KUL68758.1 4-hydroxybenzoate 3-monooxygenase [Streptomyces sp. NRRL WC-3605]KUL71826.1 4-hydroxybenzoate 3-monooxygenase [Streptomyces sp. NRRL WC-3604]
MRTTVGIIGGGPAGLLLARLLHRAGIDCVVLESRSREYVEQRQRAGMLEQGTVDALREAGAAARLDTEGLVHHGIELRFDGERHRVDFPSLTGGRTVTIYAQTEVVKDLVALQLAEGPPLLFEAEALAVEKPESGAPVVRFRHEGRERTLTCDWVAGCDGFHGISRGVLPAGRSYTRAYPYAWLGVLAEVAPSCEELIYARSERGFALHSMRSPSVSRLYLQVPEGTDARDWPDDRVWDELAARFAVGDDWALCRGPITAKSVTPMRAFVHEPMRHGRLLLAGDAAHIVPPTGAKGLNLAVSDVRILARGLVEWHRSGESHVLDHYSELCLQRVWQATRFSDDMTRMLHTRPDGDAFDHQVQLARLRRIAASREAAAELAANYSGLPLPL